MVCTEISCCFASASAASSARPSFGETTIQADKGLRRSRIDTELPVQTSMAEPSLTLLRCCFVLFAIFETWSESPATCARLLNPLRSHYTLVLWFRRVVQIETRPTERETLLWPWFHSQLEYFPDFFRFFSYFYFRNSDDSSPKIWQRATLALVLVCCRCK